MDPIMKGDCTHKDNTRSGSEKTQALHRSETSTKTHAAETTPAPDGEDAVTELIGGPRSLYLRLAVLSSTFSQSKRLSLSSPNGLFPLPYVLAKIDGLRN
ncbi:hypothetical protein FCM35_KLT05065 [Carex littledalei]|uniref:Uncharacterized protein n=1 Tax=Carex littledalei TaxID=544730 RepID=A0A833R522_9POAL|nr:hypothetical protein FCM35_KLT05065 [Carex littledalei]